MVCLVVVADNWKKVTGKSNRKKVTHFGRKNVSGNNFFSNLLLTYWMIPTIDFKPKIYYHFSILF